jgi:hypothetical protein
MNSIIRSRLNGQRQSIHWSSCRRLEIDAVAGRKAAKASAGFLLKAYAQGVHFAKRPSPSEFRSGGGRRRLSVPRCWHQASPRCANSRLARAKACPSSDVSCP